MYILSNSLFFALVRKPDAYVRRMPRDAALLLAGHAIQRMPPCMPDSISCHARGACRDSTPRRSAVESTCTAYVLRQRSPARRNTYDLAESCQCHVSHFQLGSDMHETCKAVLLSALRILDIFCYTVTVSPLLLFYLTDYYARTRLSVRYFAHIICFHSPTPCGAPLPRQRGPGACALCALS